MATASGIPAPIHDAERAERRFFLALSCLIAAIIVAGFSVNLAMGRSTFAVPAAYHIHAVVFFGWVALFLAQSGLIAADNVALHRRLGMISIVWVPLMVVTGIVIMIVVMQRTGGPFFFDQNEFVVSNILHLLLFAALVFAALRRRRYTGWHRRYMLVAMAILSGPGLGRLLPMPLMIPHAWRLMTLFLLIFPVIGMIRDKLRRGRVHPAWWCGTGAVVVTQIVADLIAYSPAGIALTEWLVAGTPGAGRPMEAFLPPGFAM